MSPKCSSAWGGEQWAPSHVGGCATQDLWVKATASCPQWLLGVAVHGSTSFLAESSETVQFSGGCQIKANLLQPGARVRRRSVVCAGSWPVV